MSKNKKNIHMNMGKITETRRRENNYANIYFTGPCFLSLAMEIKN